jgi:hypothetical protein
MAFSIVVATIPELVRSFYDDLEGLRGQLG